MKLHTAYYLPESVDEMADPIIGLPDLGKGLNTILKGYLLSLASVLTAVGVLWYLISLYGVGPLTPKSSEQASTMLFAAALLLGLAGLGSVVLILRGKWLCLASAPEQYHAKWMMYLSIVCVLAGPALNLGAFLIGDSKATRRSHTQNHAAILLHEIEKYEDGIRQLDTRGYVELAGQVIALLSTIFFVLFLRAVALCWGARTRVLFTELYLLFLGVLVAGVVLFLWKPFFVLARPRLLLALGGGWLFAGLWYFVLILSTAIGIRYILAIQPRNGANLDAPEPPRSRPYPDFLD